LQSFARFVEEGFGLSEACNEPVLFSIRIRACHVRGALACRDNVRPAISMRSPLEAPAFSLERINLPPFTYAMEAKKFEQRLPAARRYILERGLNEHRAGSESHLGIVMQGGLWNTTVRGLHLLGLADVRGRSAVPMLILNAIHPLVPEELLEFLRGKTRVLVVEEGMPNYIERDLKALAHDAKLDVEIQGKEVFSPHGEYVPALVIGGLRKFLVSANPTAQSVTAIEDRYAALIAHRDLVRAALPEPVSKRPPSFCTGCPERPVFSAMKVLRTQEPAVGDTHVAADIGCHTFSTQAPFHVGNSVLGYGMGLASSSAVAPLFGKRVMSVMGDGGFWHNGLTNGVANAMYNRQDSVLVILDNFYTSATGQHHNPSTGTNARNEPTGMTIPQALRGGRLVDPHGGLVRHREDDRYAARGPHHARERAEGRDRARRMPARAPAADPAADPDAAVRGTDGGAAAVRRGSRGLHGRPLVHAPERLSVADAARESRSAARGPHRSRRRDVRRLRRVWRGRPRGGAVPVLLPGAGHRESRLVDACRRSAAPRRHRRARAGVTTARADTNAFGSAPRRCIT